MRFRRATAALLLRSAACSTVSGSRPPPPPSVARQRHQKRPAKPQPPTDCCKSGCNPCVWDTYYDELEKWEGQEGSDERGGHETGERAGLSVAVVSAGASAVRELEENRLWAKGIVEAPVYSARQLTRPSASTRTILAVELDLSRCPAVLPAELGGHILVHCPNPPEVFQRVLRHLNLSETTVLEITVGQPHAAEFAGVAQWLGESLTVTARFLFERECDLASQRMLASRALLSLVRETATKNAQGVVPSFATLADLLDHYQPLPPLALHRLLPLLRPLLPRCYSAASSPLTRGSSLASGPRRASHFEFAFSVCEPPGGLCTRWMADTVRPFLCNGTKSGAATERRLKLPVSACNGRMEPPAFTLPGSPHAPVILCAAGSGLSPFRAMLQQRQLTVPNKFAHGPCLLYYGCRTPDSFPFREEVENFRHCGTITAMTVAYSRPSVGEPRHVTAALRAEGSELVRLMCADEMQAVFYVCGSIKMQRDVVAVWVELLMAHGLIKSAAEELLKQWQTSNRYRYENWHESGS